MPKAAPRLLLHEVAFGLLLLFLWARSSVSLGLFHPYAVVPGGLFALSAVLIWACERDPCDLRWRARLLFYPIAMSVVYVLIGRAVPLMQPRMRDALLARLDSALFDGSAVLLVAPFRTPLLTEVLSFCYMLFIPYVIASMLVYYLSPVQKTRAFYLGLFTIYGLGMLGYMLVPASGPYIIMRDQMGMRPEGWWFTHLNQQMVKLGSNQVDVFPSLHCAASSFILFFDRTHMPGRFRLYLLPCIGLWFSTVYLGYHYFVDVVAGFALSAFALWVVRRAESANTPEFARAMQPAADQN